MEDPHENVSKAVPGPDSVIAKDSGGQRTRGGCSQQGGSPEPLPGGHRAALQGHLWPRAAAPGGTVPPHPPGCSAPAAAPSSLVPKSDGTQTKGLRTSCHGGFQLTRSFPRVFRETFEAGGHTAVPGVHSRAGGCTALCLPRQRRHPAVLA